MANIDKIRISGVTYDIGGSGGGVDSGTVQSMIEDYMACDNSNAVLMVTDIYKKINIGGYSYNEESGNYSIGNCQSYDYSDNPTVTYPVGIDTYKRVIGTDSYSNNYYAIGVVFSYDQRNNIPEDWISSYRWSCTNFQGTQTIEKNKPYDSGYMVYSPENYAQYSDLQDYFNEKNYVIFWAKWNSWTNGQRICSNVMLDGTNYYGLAFYDAYYGEYGSSNAAWFIFDSQYFTNNYGGYNVQLNLMDFSTTNYDGCEVKSIKTSINNVSNRISNVESSINSVSSRVSTVENSYAKPSSTANTSNKLVTIGGYSLSNSATTTATTNLSLSLNGYSMINSDWYVNKVNGLAMIQSGGSLDKDVRGDWNDNVSRSPNYIKNKPFYTETGITSEQVYASSTPMEFYSLNVTFDRAVQVGNELLIKLSYDSSDDGWNFGGGTIIETTDEYTGYTSKKYFVPMNVDSYMYASSDDLINWNLNAGMMGQSSVYVKVYENINLSIIHKLDSKYIDDDIARVSDIPDTSTFVQTTEFTGHTADTTVHVTSTEKSTWNNKQDAIDDLSTIRSNASTALSKATANETSLGGIKLMKISQADYDALETKDSSTLYIIVDE